MIIEKLPITDANFRYFYRGWVERVVDGDTIHLSEFDMGRNRYDKDVSLRLCNPDWSWLDAWELSPRKGTIEERAYERIKGLAAQEFLANILLPGTEVVVLTNRDRDGTFRDLAGAVFVRHGTGWYDVAATLAAWGHLKS